MDHIALNLSSGRKLRYGENPHQEGWFYQTETSDPLAIQNFDQLQGKELSFNNYLDISGCLDAISNVGGNKPACMIVKHTNPCGAATRDTIEEAYKAAWYEGDSLAAFGGIMATNREVDAQLATKMIENFFEVLLAPSVTEEAKETLAKKKNLRVLTHPELKNPAPAGGNNIHQVRGGFLVQDTDTKNITKQDLEVVTRTQPTDEQIEDLLFAWNICRVSKSNTIVAAKNQTLIASGVGQQDRKRCCELCLMKAGERMQWSVVASDAFFPFRDGPDTLIQAGVKAIIQPGGSIKDQDTIDACNEAGVAMVFTSIRAFRH